MSGDITGAARAELMVSELQRFIDNYRGLTFPGENISEGLRSVRNVYDADIAFILEMDSEIKGYRIMSVSLREGLEGFGEVLTQNVIARNLFADIVKPEKPAFFTDIELEEEFPAEYDWMNLNGVRSIMLSPILTRTQMEAFIGVCNVGRMFGDPSMLKFSTVMLTNEIRAVTVMDKYAKVSNRSVILEDNDVLVNMFGGLEIWTRRGKLDLGSAASSKSCLLLIYLIFNKDRIVPVRELADILWPNQLFDNPYNMVKGVVFRLKKLLDPICEKKVIIAQQGTYMINSELYLLLDTQDFERICRILKRQGLTPRERENLYKRAISCYKGNLLPNFEDEIWLVGKMNYYQIMYSSLVREYLIFLDRTGDVEDFFSVVSKVMNILYPDGEIYNIIISVLIRQNKMDIARNCYLKVEKLLSPEQRQVFIDVWNKAGIK